MILVKDIIGKKVKCVSDCGEYYQSPPVGEYGTIVGFWGPDDLELDFHVSIEVEIGDTTCHWFWKDFELAEHVPLIEIDKKYAI